MRYISLLCTLFLQSYAVENIERVEIFDKEIKELRESVNILKKENSLLQKELKGRVDALEIEKKFHTEKALVKEKTIYVKKPLIKEKIIYIDKPVEKIVYREKPIIKYREKKVYIEKPHIKYLEKPVVKVVEVEKIVEKSCFIKNSFPELLMKRE